LGAAFLTDHFEALMEDAHFTSISKSMITAVLPFDELRVSSELVALQALLKLKWIHDFMPRPARSEQLVLPRSQRF
jgi:hypothetical protein